MLETYVIVFNFQIFYDFKSIFIHVLSKWENENSQFIPFQWLIKFSVTLFKVNSFEELADSSLYDSTWVMGFIIRGR